MHDQSICQSIAQHQPDTPLRALLLDDSQFDRTRIRRLTDQAQLNIDLVEVDTLAEMKFAADDTQYDLFLIDYRLPVGDGFEAMQMLRADPRNDAAGNILITGDPELSTAVHAMRNGYHDVLSKNDITAEHLRSAIQHAMSQARGPFTAPFSQHQLYENVKEAISHPALQAQLGRILSDHLTTGPYTTRTEYDLLLRSFLEEDEFLFEMQGLK